MSSSSEDPKKKVAVEIIEDDDEFEEFEIDSKSLIHLPTIFLVQLLCPLSPTVSPSRGPRIPLLARSCRHPFNSEYYI